VGGLAAISNAAVDVVVAVFAVSGVAVLAVFAGDGAETDAGAGAGAGAGVEAREDAGDGVPSVVRKQRSLIISFCGLTTGSCSGGEGSSRD
jgi:hypothetical protein